ncbi:hypothetical protein [Nocardioides sp.]|uniref:hypothetical protein n=1 Tax=Nocardioides sp. TaxID=35761 RepID=UPI0035645A2B
MPFCAGCDRFYNPNTLDRAGDCPEGHHVADPGAAPAAPTVPWHFKVMLAFLIVYLGWRLVQLVGWLL